MMTLININVRVRQVNIYSCLMLKRCSNRDFTDLPKLFIKTGVLVFKVLR